MAITVGAQQLRSDYITWPSSERLQNYVNAWQKGESLTKTWGDGGVESTWDDEEFFISRVKLKPYIRNVNTQVYSLQQHK